jgi:hypothetical protein
MAVWLCLHVWITLVVTFMDEPVGKTKLECEKLDLEIRALKKPFRNNPAHWISSATALLAITALFFQYRLSQNEFILAETKSVQAKIDTEKAEETTKRLREDVKILEEDIATKSKQRDQLEALVRNADSLLSKAQTTADPKLRGEIKRLRETTNPSSPFWASLPQIVNQPEIKEAAHIERVLRDGNDQITRARGEIQSKELSGFQNSQTGYNADVKNKRVENQLAFMKPGYQSPKSYTKYIVQIVGNDLEFSFYDVDKPIIFYRTRANQPVYDQAFQEAVKRSIEPQLQTELNRSD